MCMHDTPGSSVTSQADSDSGFSVALWRHWAGNMKILLGFNQVKKSWHSQGSSLLQGSSLTLRRPPP